MTPPVISCRDLTKWYGDVIAVNDLSVEVEPGITGLLGPNGAGKSTLMRLATGLLRPSKGRVSVLGEDPWDNTELRRRVGFVPEGDAPWRDRTGLEAATLAARLSGHEPDDAEERARNALSAVELDEIQGAVDKRVGAYSRGMRQRFKLALALLDDPELLILDEPLQGTDPLVRRDLIDLIKGLARDGDRSVVVSTHVLPDVEAMTQRILLLNRGRLVAHGDVQDIPDMLDRYPRTIRIGTPAARELGSDLLALDSVEAVDTMGDALQVRTSDPAAFHASLQEILLETDVEFQSIKALDENVEAIFRHLVD